MWSLSLSFLGGTGTVGKGFLLIVGEDKGDGDGEVTETGPLLSSVGSCLLPASGDCEGGFVSTAREATCFLLISGGLLGSGGDSEGI